MRWLVTDSLIPGLTPEFPRSLGMVVQEPTPAQEVIDRYTSGLSASGIVPPTIVHSVLLVVTLATHPNGVLVWVVSFQAGAVYRPTQNSALPLGSTVAETMPLSKVDADLELFDAITGDAIQGLSLSSPVTSG